MIGTILRTLLAAQAGAAARSGIRAMILSMVAALIVGALAATGFAFLVTAAHEALRDRLDAPEAALVLGLALLALAGMTALVFRYALRPSRRTAASGISLDPALASVRSVLEGIPAPVLSALVAGFLFGLKGRRR